MNDIQNQLNMIISNALFDGKRPTVNEDQIASIINESKAQAVFPLLFSVLDSQLQEKLNSDRYTELREEFFCYAIANTQNFSEHSELHELMTTNGIPYVVMKGFASAMYYPDPSLRSMGDVDFIVNPDNLRKAGDLLESIGFTIDHGVEDENKHIAYTRPPMSIWELHRTVNGIPNGKVGQTIQAEIDRAIDTAALANQDDVTCMAPDKLHHGLIMLLHTASHLTSEGVGLRHLCDWVVFASSMSDSEFREIFEKKLKSFGLWHFAQVLTLLGINYLGAPKRVWALEAIESHEVNDETLVALMDDILSGGNFGTKDANRYREIKYISDRNENTVSRKGIVTQGIKSLNEKTYRDFSFIDKHKVLLLVGWIAESGKYIGLLLGGKRKSSGTKNMLKEAGKRKKLYASLELFQTKQ